MGDSQGTAGEDDKENNLLPHGDLQVLEQRQREGHQDNVRHDIDAGVGEGDGVPVEASALHAERGRPVERDGDAGEDGAEDGPDAVEDQEDDQAPEDLLHQRRAEDAVALQRDGELAEDEGEVVDGDGDPESLRESVSESS